MIPGIAAKTALGRLGEPDDIGMMLATLLSERGSLDHPKTIEVDGGCNL